MRSWVEYFRVRYRHLMSRLQVRGLTDDHADREILDRVWRAECDEMAAILERKNPGRDR